MASLMDDDAYKRAIWANAVSTMGNNIGSALMQLGSRGRIAPSGGGMAIDPLAIYKVQAAQEQLRLQRERQAAWSNLFGAAPSAQASPAAPLGGTGQTPASLMDVPAPTAAEPSAGLMGLTPQQRAMLLAAGPDKGVGLLAQFTKPDVPTGMRQNPDGTWSYDPAYLAGQKELKAAGAPTTSVEISQAAATKGMEELDKAIGKNLAAQVDSGNKARSSIARIGQMRDLVTKYEAAGGETGALAPLRLRAGETVRSLGLPQDFFGLPSDAEISYGQVIESLSNQLALGKIGGEDGMPANNFSEADRNFIVSTVAGLGDSPAAFRSKLAIQERMDQRAMEIERVILEGREVGRSVSDIRSDIQSIVAQPLFSNEEKSGLEAPQSPKTYTPAEYQKMSDDELMGIIRGGS